MLFCMFMFSASAQSQRMMRTNSNDDVEVKVEVFPNPTSEFLNIDLSYLKLVNPKIEFRSIIGTRMTVNLQRNGLNKYKVDVQNFPRGYYLVLVRDDPTKFQQTVRFSKK